MLVAEKAGCAALRSRECSGECRRAPCVARIPFCWPAWLAWAWRVDRSEIQNFCDNSRRAPLHKACLPSQLYLQTTRKGRGGKGAMHCLLPVTAHRCAFMRQPRAPWRDTEQASRGLLTVLAELAVAALPPPPGVALALASRVPPLSGSRQVRLLIAPRRTWGCVVCAGAAASSVAPSVGTSVVASTFPSVALSAVIAAFPPVVPSGFLLG